MQDNATQLKQHQFALLEGRYLAKRLQRAVGVLLLVILIYQLLLVGKPRFFERPADLRSRTRPCAKEGTHLKALIVIIEPPGGSVALNIGDGISSALFLVPLRD